MKLHPIFHRYMAPAGEGDAGGAADRGDEFVPTEDEPVVAAAKTEEVKETDEPPPKVDKGLKQEAETKKPTVEEAAATIAAAEAAAKAKTDEARIPAARHKEILEAERARRAAVESELAQYKQGGKIVDLGAKITEAETSLIELETAYAKQLVDGETVKAAATMAQIRKTERSINEQSAIVREQAAEARAVERVRYDTTVERLEEQFPALNVDHESFDKAKTAEILELKEAYQLKGYTPSAALQRAVKLIMPPTTKAQETAVETTARVDAASVEAARKTAAVEATTKAIAATPANAAKVGIDGDKMGGGAITAKDAMKMSYKDFSALDDAALAKMRGDVL